MEPTLTWIDLTAADRDRVRRVLDLFKEQGTIDEMGLGSLRDALADALFPGTSTLHTRLRYVLFIPWIYQRLMARGISSAEVATRARAAEIELIGPLSAGDDRDGIIGARARRQLERVPSSVYWGALVRWGLFTPARSQGWLHARFGSIARGTHGLAHPDDPGVPLTRETLWHSRLPAAPEGFPWGLSFALLPAEAEFLQGRLEQRCAGSLLALLAREGAPDLPEAFWEVDRLGDLPPFLSDTIEIARRFSLLVEGMPLLYNLLLAERLRDMQGSQRDEDLVGSYREELAEWADQESAEAPFDLRRLWDFMALRGQRVPSPQKDLVDLWAAGCKRLGAAAVADDPTLRAAVEHRERSLKGAHRARLANPARLIDWTGRAGVGRMTFRWPQTRRLLTDLHRGLGQGH